MRDGFSGDDSAKDDSDVERDLFGAPVGQIRERWGRPSFKKTQQNQELVALLRADGWTHDRIAAYLGCDAKTLAKHFSRELQYGSDLIRGMALQVTLQRMRQGNSVATGRLLDLTLEAGNPAVPIVPKPDKAAPLGKKEAALAEAQTAHEGTVWGDILQ
ncbi:hypothetical protein [Phreatobacter sp.]|uniref:hypothetical protein n=1 Tax=Phreatobacter sp. TaxID=1966341 RepID=UPI003F716C90